MHKEDILEGIEKGMVAEGENEVPGSQDSVHCHPCTKVFLNEQRLFWKLVILQPMRNFWFRKEQSGIVK